MSLKGKRSTWSVLVVALSMVLAFAGLAAAYTPAGTQISNIATATYKVGTQERVSSSNIVYVTVEQIHGVEVGPNDAQNRTVVAGQVVQQVFTVENTGNAPDTFNLTAVLEGTHD